jgi:hypothetical protein
MSQSIMPAMDGRNASTMEEHRKTQSDDVETALGICGRGVVADDFLRLRTEKSLKGMLYAAQTIV